MRPVTSENRFEPATVGPDAGARPLPMVLVKEKTKSEGRRTTKKKPIQHLLKAEDEQASSERATLIRCQETDLVSSW